MRSVLGALGADIIQHAQQFRQIAYGEQVRLENLR